MTKPLTSVAAMMLYEQGRLALRQPIAEILPEFADARVYSRLCAQSGHRAGRADPGLAPADPHLRHDLRLPAQTRWTTRDRLMDVEFFPPDDFSLADAVQRWATVPLLFQPGTGWNYGVSTDVLGRVVEVVSGMPLDRFFAEHITGPLGMVDTAFTVPAEKADRFAGLYATGTGRPDPQGQLHHRPARHGHVLLRRRRAGLHSGGLPAFHQDAAGPGRAGRSAAAGQPDGGLHGPQSPARQRRHPDHRPADQPPRRVRRGGLRARLRGVGRPGPDRGPASPGEYSWGGLASTTFWVDPVERITAVFMTQLIPSATYPIRPELRGW